MYFRDSQCLRAQQANKNRYRKLLWCFGLMFAFLLLMYVLHCVELVTNDLVIYYAAVDKAKGFGRIQIHSTFPLEEFRLIVFWNVLYPTGHRSLVTHFLQTSLSRNGVSNRVTGNGQFCFYFENGLIILTWYACKLSKVFENHILRASNSVLELLYVSFSWLPDLVILQRPSTSLICCRSQETGLPPCVWWSLLSHNK